MLSWGSKEANKSAGGTIEQVSEGARKERGRRSRELFDAIVKDGKKGKMLIAPRKKRQSGSTMIF